MPWLRIVPPLCWTALIAWFSTDHWSSASTGPRVLPILGAILPWAGPETLDAIHWLARTGGHVADYAVLAGLWAWALGGWRRALGLSVATAFLDELHQSSTQGREGSAVDLLLDSASAAAVLLVARLGLGRALALATGALLWIGAAGGTALLAVNLAAGAPSGWLWLSVPSAWIALVLWTRAKRP